MFYLMDRLKITWAQMMVMPEWEYQHWYIYHANRAQKMELAEKMATSKG